MSLNASPATSSGTRRPGRLQPWSSAAGTRLSSWSRSGSSWPDVAVTTPAEPTAAGRSQPRPGWAWGRARLAGSGPLWVGDTFLDGSPDYAGDRAFPAVVVPPGFHPVPAHRHRAPAPRPVPGGVEEPQHAVRVLAVFHPVRRRFQQLKQALGSQRPAARPARRPAVSGPAPACR